MDKEQRVTKSYRETSLFVIVVSVFFGFFHYFFIAFAMGWGGNSLQDVFNRDPLLVLSFVFLAVPVLASITNLFQPSKSLSQLAFRLLPIYFALLVFSFVWHR